MIENILKKAINEEVENRVKEFKIDYKNNSKKIIEQDKIIQQLSKENNILKIENNKNQNKKILLDLFQKIYNEDNLYNLIELLNYEKVNHIGRGMSVDEINPVFRLIFEYYNNKNDILNICDILNIKYSDWYKTYKMPYEYDVDTIKLFLKK